MVQIREAGWLTILVERKMLEIHEESFLLTILPLPLDNTISLTCIDFFFSFFNG
jgi:hypothetical protein